MQNKSDNQEFSMHLSRREMRAYLKENLSAQDVSKVDKHLKHCAHCSMAMAGVVAEEDPTNYKKNVAKVNDKLKVPIKKSYHFDSAKIKKSLAIAAGVGVLSLSGYAMYSFVQDEPGSDRLGATIPVKPKKEKSEIKSDGKNIADKADAGKEKTAEKQKKDNTPLPTAKKETKADKQAVLKEEAKKKEEVKNTQTALQQEEKEKASTEVSNTMLVARRKEKPVAHAEAVVTKTDAEEGENSEAKVADANPIGGYGALNQYLAGNLQYPEGAIESKIEGQVPVEFFVEEDGALSGFTVKKPIGYGCDKEAIRLIKEGPKWNPATENGKEIGKKVTVTVHFKLEE